MSDSEEVPSFMRHSGLEGTMDAEVLKKIGDEVNQQEPFMNVASGRTFYLDPQASKYSEGDSVSAQYEQRNVLNKDLVKKDRFDYCDSRILKASQIWKLREELTKARNTAEEEKVQRKKFEDRLRELEQKLNVICSAERAGSKQEKLLEEDNATLRSKLLQLREEMEELRVVITENNDKMEEYRAKYMQAQQEAEEYRRQLEIIDFDNKQVSDQIQTEIQRVKVQFQEKLQELSPLPDLLKGSQLQLQEAKQLQQLAEENCDHLSAELGRIKEKVRKLFTIHE